MNTDLTRRAALCGIASIPAIAGATAAIAANPAPSALSGLIDAHKAAYAAFSKAMKAADADPDDARLSDATSAASECEGTALCAILEYRPASQADALAKVAYLGPLNRRGQCDQQIHFDHLLASLLPEGEWLPREWWGWRTEYEVEVSK